MLVIIVLGIVFVVWAYRSSLSEVVPTKKDPKLTPGVKLTKDN